MGGHNYSELNQLTDQLMSQEKPGPDPSMTDAEIVEHIVASNVPVATASDIATVADVSRAAARERLERLVERDALRRKDAGAGVVYYPNCYDPAESD
jgi:Fic family protein